MFLDVTEVDWVIHVITFAPGVTRQLASSFMHHEHNANPRQWA